MRAALQLAFLCVAAAAAPNTVVVAPKRVAEAVVLLDYAAVGAMRTVLLFASKSLGGGPMLLASLESAFGVGQVGGALVVGRMSDFYGRKALLMICLCCSGMAYALAGTALEANYVALLLLARFPAGISKQLTTTARAIVCDSTPAAERSSGLSELYACCALGFALGPLLGGELVEQGRESRCAFAAAFGYLAMMPLISKVLSETMPTATARPNRASPGQSRTPTRRSVWREPAILRSLLSTSLPEAALVMHTSIAQPLLCRAFGLSPKQVGWLACAQGLAGAFFALVPLPICFRNGILNESRALALTNLLLLFASAAIALRPSAGTLWACLLPFALAVSLQRAAAASIVSKAAAADAQGDALGALDAVSSVCRIVVPVAAGALVSKHGAETPYAAQAVLSTLGLGAWFHWAQAADRWSDIHGARPKGARSIK